MKIKQFQKIPVSLIASVIVLLLIVISLWGFWRYDLAFEWQLILAIILAGMYYAVFCHYSDLFLRDDHDYRAFIILFLITNICVQITGGFDSNLLLFYVLLAILTAFRYHFWVGVGTIFASAILEGTPLLLRGSWPDVLMYVILASFMTFLIGFLFQRENQEKEKINQQFNRIKQDIETIKHQSDEISESTPPTNEEESRRLLARHLQFQKNLKVMLSLCKTAFQTHTTVIFLYDHSSESYTLRAILSDIDESFQNPNAYFKKDDEILGWVVREKRGLLINNLGERVHQLPYYHQAENINALIAVPLLSTTNFVEGVFIIDHPHQNAYVSWQQQLLEDFANIILQNVINFRDYEDCRMRRLYLNALYKISEMFTAQLRPDETLTLLADVTRKIVICDGLIIATYDESQTQGIVEIMQGDSYPFLVGFEFPLDGGLVGWIIRHQKPLMMGDLQREINHITRFYKTEPRSPFRSFLGVPLMTQQKTIGALIVEHKNVDIYNENTLQILQILANLVAMVHINYAMYAEVQRLAETDGLTGLLTHTQFQQALDEALQTAQKKHISLSLLYIDIDDFQRINLREGFSTGDTILKELAYLVRGFVGKKGHVGRYTNTQIAAVLYDTPRQKAVETAELLLRQIRERTFITENKRTIQITASIAVINYPHDVETKIGMIELGQNTLKEAKKRGKNRVQAYAAK